MGLYHVTMFMFLFGFGIGVIFANYMCEGLCYCLMICCYMWVRYTSPSGPMCLRYLMLTLTGHVEYFFTLFYCLLDLCCGESYCSLCVFLYVCLFVLCVLCLTVLVNCLLNVFDICVGEVIVFSFKVNVLFMGCVWSY